jgi:hypothetical protein
MKVEILYDALYDKYKAKQTEALCNLQMYFMEGVGVADHPDTVKTAAKLFEDYFSATEYLKLLRESKYELIGE